MGENKGYITNTDERGSINISEDVIALIAAAAATEVDGVAGLFPSHSRDISPKLGRKGLSKGVKISVEEKKVTIDINIIADLGSAVNEVGAEVQTAVINAVEAAAGLTLDAVNVHVCGIYLKKDR